MAKAPKAEASAVEPIPAAAGLISAPVGIRVRRGCWARLWAEKDSGSIEPVNRQFAKSTVLNLMVQATRSRP